MRKRHFRMIIMLILFIGCYVNVNATTYTIGASGQDFDSIQVANDDVGVANGDTLYIVDDTLTEGDISIDKDLVIIGSGSLNTSVLQAAADSGTAGYGVMYINSANTVKLVNLTIQHGVAAQGGGIENAGYLEMYHCIVQKNVSTDISSSGGGGIDNEIRLTLFETDFIDNYSYGHGGAINMEDDGSLFAEGCSFMHNIAEYGGGAIGMPYGDTLYLDGCVFDGNTAQGGQGGAILDGGGNSDEIIYIGNSEFRNNSAYNNGGAIHLYMDSTFMENCIIEDNYAEDHGGGIYVYEGTLVVDSCTFQNNESLNGGGGIYNSDGDDMLITNSLIQDNITGDYGGGGVLSEAYGEVIFDNCIVQGNSTIDGGGGGLNIWYPDTLIIMNSSIVNNTTAKRGGGINLYESNAYLYNTSITDNYAAKTGGGINGTGYTLYLDFVTLTNNISGKEGGGLNVFMNDDEQLFDSVFFKNTVIANNYDSTMLFPDIQDDSLRIISLGNNFIGNLGNFEFVNNAAGDMFGDTANTTSANAGAIKYNVILDPMLGDLEGEADALKYRTPMPCSPLMDAADDNSMSGMPVVTDMLGNTRPIGQGNDIGAIEASMLTYAVTGNVSGVSLTGFSVAMDMAVDGLDASNFMLDNGGHVTAATTSDGGDNYSVTTNALTKDVEYTLSVSADCYTITVEGDDILIPDNSTSIEDNQLNTISIYPNPANDVLFIKGLGNLSGLINIDIIDITGKVVQSSELQVASKMELNLSDLKSGVYIIQLHHSDFTHNQKLLVE